MPSLLTALYEEVQRNHGGGVAQAQAEVYEDPSGPVLPGVTRPYVVPSAGPSQTGAEQDIHPQVNLLLNGFIKYLKEPRYQAPLTLDELSRLFQYFYKDLNALTINLYTQQNSTKKKLISHSRVFSEDEKRFDYLLAIANFSASTVKLTKRTDQDALVQLRIFNYYKFLTISETIEQAQRKLFNSTNTSGSGSGGSSNATGSARVVADSITSPTSDDETSLYDKIFRFEQKDLIYQEFLDEKLAALKDLQLPLSCFVEEEGSPLEKVFTKASLPNGTTPTEDGLRKSAVQEINALFLRLNSSPTPLSKLKLFVSIQKLLIHQIAELAFDGSTSPVNNDILLPSLIYYVINYLPPFDQVELFLNFTFMKNFLNLIPTDSIDLSTLTPSMNLNNYQPTDKSKFKSYQRGKKGTLFDFLNLHPTEDTPGESIAAENESPDKSDLTFASDKALVTHIQREFLNNGELMFYLTNFEAVIFFLSKVTIDELKVPTEHRGTENASELLKVPLDKLVDTELLKHFQLPAGELGFAAEDVNGDPVKEDVLDLDVEIAREDLQSIHSGGHFVEDHFESGTGGGNRSRSSSLFNTISHRLNDAASTVNRSRSNSSILNSLKSATKETFPSLSSPLHTRDTVSSSSASNGSGEPESIETSPVNSNEPHALPMDPATNSLSMMKNILGKFSQISVPQIKHFDEHENIGIAEEEQTQQLGQPSQPGAVIPESIPADGTTPIMKVASPNRASPRHSRTRSSSLDNQLKRNSITSKFTTGVSELMTKLNNTNTNTSTLSLHSMGDTNNSSVNNTNNEAGPLNGSSGHTHGHSYSLSQGSSAGIAIESPTKRPEYARSRTTSLQIMDKWFSNISNISISNPMNASVIAGNGAVAAAPVGAHSTHSAITLGGLTPTVESIEPQQLAEIVRFQNAEFDSLTVNDLKNMKSNYDKLCAIIAPLLRNEADVIDQISHSEETSI